MKDKIKEILDKDCNRSRNEEELCHTSGIRTPCYICKKNEDLAREIAQELKSKDVLE